MSETLTPVFRLEYFITAAANGTPCDLEPIFNEEKYLHAIAGASVDLPMPVGRTQEYLAKLAGMDVEIPGHPIFRTEYYLAHMIDSTVECPAPIFREEMFYYEWAVQEYVTVTGNPVTFTTTSASLLRKLSIAFSPVQDLHGQDAPYPAGGGKNKAVLDSAYSNTKNGVTVEVTASGEIWVHGTPDIESGLIQFQLVGTVPSSVNGQTVCVSVNEKTAGVGFVVGSGNGSLNLTMSDTITYKTGTYTAGTNIIVVNVSYDVGNIDKKYKFQIELGSSPTSYAPYSNICPISGWDSLTVYHSGADTSDPQTISISLGSTYYSGWVDAVTGIGEIDWVGVDGGSLTWKKVNGNAYRTFAATPSPTPKKGNDPSTAINVICDNYRSESFSTASQSKDNYIWVSAESSDQLCIKDTSRAGMSVSDFTAYMTGMTIVYRLATPIPIQLTPQEINSLAGDNTMWSNANQPITVEYRKN